MTVSPFSTPLDLRPDEVHVWIVEPERIDDPRLLEAYKALLDTGERERQRRFHFERHQRQYLVSHALVRLTLSRYAPVAPEAWRFVPNEYGRPAIVGPEGQWLRFNLSHTDGMALVAVGRDVDLGADIEDAERPGETVEIADHYFAKTEVQALRSLPKERQRERFFEYWTLKEAYIKARGAGLSLPLDQFGFDLVPGQMPGIRFDPRMNDLPDVWQFMQHKPSARHQAALAFRRPRSGALTVRWQHTVPLAGDMAPVIKTVQAGG
ncbi:4'-phosphopantetheinyl transferase superfamily protein [Corallococcus exiguus]|uniref:4'-phosphopantetheinyl transferase family protein n=1 Tax=Corallococcus exiguus TaxID=83462 RepID=UPI0014946A66|nr:4'-phosphopantetheinyl transferase superfamily protein [Corallococcus exiguus]NPC72615.1 4'-phosphopantetheinyl transferase superfamily protein [Corallococcus exiguus]